VISTISSIVFYLAGGIPNTLQSVSYYCSVHVKFWFCLLSYFIKYTGVFSHGSSLWNCIYYTTGIWPDLL